MGSALSAFTTFWNTTGPNIMSGRDKFLNEALLQTYVLSMFLRGREANEILRGGQVIRDYVVFDDVSTAEDYQVNDPWTYNLNQSGRMVSQNWRFKRDYAAVNEIELALQNGGSDADRFQVFKDRRNIEMQRMHTSIINKHEADLWANPASDQAQMEAESGKKTMSIPAFINEETYGLPTGWTTVQGENPTTNSKWRPALQRYDYADILDAGSDFGGIFDAFDALSDDITFEAPPDPVPLGQEGVTSKQECFIVTSDKGRRLFMKALRNSNQILLGDRQDPRYNKPRYDGWKIINVKTLNQATLYPASAGQAYEDGATTTAGGTITNTGPRFYFINPKALTYFFHKDGYFKKMDSLKHPNNPETMIFPMRCWGNLFCRSRRRLGMVAPGA